MHLSPRGSVEAVGSTEGSDWDDDSDWSEEDGEVINYSFLPTFTTINPITLQAIQYVMHLMFIYRTILLFGMLSLNFSKRLRSKCIWEVSHNGISLNLVIYVFLFRFIQFFNSDDRQTFDTELNHLHGNVQKQILDLLHWIMAALKVSSSMGWSPSANFYSMSSNYVLHWSTYSRNFIFLVHIISEDLLNPLLHYSQSMWVWSHQVMLCIAIYVLACVELLVIYFSI